MRILFCTNVYPPDRGGVAAFSKDLVGLLQHIGHEVRTFNEKRNVEPQHLQNLFGQFYARCQFYAISLVSLIKMSLTIGSFRPKFVICSTWMPYGPFAYLLKIFFGFRLIIQVYGTEISGRYKIGWRRKILAKLLNSADMLWPISFYSAQLLSIYNCRKDKIKIVRPILPAEALLAAESYPNIKIEQPPIILTAAHLYPRKGIDLVLKALSNLKDLSWQYLVAGEAPPPWSREHYECMATELGIRNRVTFLGQIPRERVWKLMGKSYLFVMPSRAIEDDIESFGIVYIEAQLFNLPCIGTRFGGIPDAVQDGVTGILIENQDVRGLTAAIEMLLKDQTKAIEMGKMGRERAFHLFSENARRKTVISLLKTMNCK